MGFEPLARTKREPYRSGFVAQPLPWDVQMQIHSAYILGAALSIALLVGDVSAEEKALRHQIIGTWIPIEIVNVARNGTETSAWDQNRLGILMFDAGGHFTQTLLRSDLPKYAAGDRMKGTSEENRATVQGMLTFFGTYTIGDDNDSLTYRIQGSSYPNFNGRITKRTASISDDRLKITFAGSARGGAGYQIWKRLK